MEPQSAFAVYRKVNPNKGKKSKNKRKAENLQEHAAPKKLKSAEIKKNGAQNVLQNDKAKNKKKKRGKKVNGLNQKEEETTDKPLIQLKQKSNQKPPQQNGTRKIHSESEDEPPLLVPLDASAEIVEATEIRTKKTEKNKKESFENYKSFTHTDTNPVTYGSGTFNWLIHPIKPREFFEKYWEKDVLHVKRNKNSYYEDILSTEKLDSILREYNLNFTKNVDVVTYENGVKEVHNQEGRAVPSVLWDFYSNGCSIRVLNPQTYDQNVHSIISSLQEYFGTMVGTNVYLTPPGSQGFAPHYDDIEAFIVQLEGRKHWKLYKPKGADILARDSSHNFNAKDLEKPFMEVCLNAGDLLYFPRGTIHEGRTDENSHSLHITISVYQHTAYADLLEHVLPVALKKAANEDINFRKGLPINYLKHVGHINKDCTSSKRVAILKNTKKLLQKLIDHIDVDLAADQLGRKFMRDAMPPLYSAEEAMRSSKYDGDYMRNGRVFNRVEIESETKVRLLRYHSIRLVAEPNISAKLYYCTDNAKYYHGEEEQWLEIDSKLIPGLKMLQNKYPEFVEVDELPIDDSIARLQLVADLWERGLIVTSEPLPSISSDVDEDATDSDEDAYEFAEEAIEGDEDATEIGEGSDKFAEDATHSEAQTSKFADDATDSEDDVGSLVEITDDESGGTSGHINGREDPLLSLSDTE